MPATKVQRLKPVPTPPAAVPLADISITWPLQSWWGIGTEPVTITGRRLADALDAVIPGLRASEDQARAGVDIAAARLHGLAVILDHLADGDITDSPEDVESATQALADYVRRLRMDIIRLGHCDEQLAKAVVTIAGTGSQP